MLVQDAKFKRLTDHPMNKRMSQPVCKRLKRNSFFHQAKELIKQNTDLHNHTPTEIPTCLSVPPWKSEVLPYINMKISGVEDKRLQTPEERRNIKDDFLNIDYPCDSWTRVYTDGSVEDTIRNGGAGVCVQHSVDDEEHVSIPTGLHSTNYKAETMALEEAATILERSERAKNNVVFLTDPPQEYILVAERRLSHAAGHETKCTRANPNQVLQVGGWLRVNSPYRKITLVTETQTDIRNNIQVLGGVEFLPRKIE